MGNTGSFALAFLIVMVALTLWSWNQVEPSELRIRTVDGSYSKQFKLWTGECENTLHIFNQVHADLGVSHLFEVSCYGKSN